MRPACGGGGGGNGASGAAAAATVPTSQRLALVETVSCVTPAALSDEPVPPPLPCPLPPCLAMGDLHQGQLH